MSRCFGCKHKGELSHVCDECFNGEMFEKEVVTNADRIRSMTNEELAGLIDNSMNVFSCPMCDMYEQADICEPEDCYGYILKWLKKEIK